MYYNCVNEVKHKEYNNINRPSSYRESYYRMPLHITHWPSSVGMHHVSAIEHFTIHLIKNFFRSSGCIILCLCEN